MAIITKKDKFFEVLRNIFVGAKIDGNSGYVNLMRIKSKYYSEFKEQLQTDIDKKLKEVGKNFEEELYNKLFTFFKKYFSESGSIYFSYTPLQEKVYERIYRDDKDVMLFWKTHMLYYVKTERLYKNMDVEDPDTLILYKFDVNGLEHKKNNEKKELVFDFVKAENSDKRRIQFSVKYSVNGTKTKIDDIHKRIKKSSGFAAVTLKEVERALSIFKRQSEVDYFINKNAKEFLREQFSLWVKGYLLDDETLFEEQRLKQLKALQSIAFNIIDLVSQFEDELVKIWNKPKFAHSSNYVITLDKIGDKDFALLEKLLKHKGIAEQTKEWNDLGMIDKKFDAKDITKTKKLNEQWKYLPLDTKHFKDLELDILSLFDDLDNQLDGWLINSENYQALKSLRSKYYNKADTVYIDPPYNAKSSEIIYINEYKHSSFASFLDNRVEITKSFLKSTGVFQVAIDENELENVGKILELRFPEYEKVCVSIEQNPRGIQGDNFSYSNEFTFFLCPKKGVIQAEEIPEAEWEYSNFRNWGGESERTDAKNCFYPVFVKDNKVIGCGEVCDDDFHPKKRVIKKKDHYEVYPIDNEGEERKWRYAKDTFKKVKDILRVKEDDIDIELPKVTKQIKTIWKDKKYDAGTYGTRLLKNMLGHKNFDFPKSLYNVQDCILANTRYIKDAFIIDYFGGSGTTAHSVIDANKIDNGKRKFLLIELGKHFVTAIVPRVKKLAFSDKWKKGISDNGNGYSIFFKYYELEQYEEALIKLKYEDKNALPTQDIYHQYLFLKDLKMADEVVKLDEKSKSIKADLTKLHDKIDIPETLSHLTGKFIKRIRKNEVVFTDDTKIDFSNIDYKIVKPLIWW